MTFSSRNTSHSQIQIQIHPSLVCSKQVIIKIWDSGYLVSENHLPKLWMKSQKATLQFQELLTQSEKEYGYEYPMGGLTIPCSEDAFVELTSRLNVK
jgi:hypothetical protein